jgi:hypothetical protein
VLGDVDTQEPERLVVPAPLQHLREVALDAARATGVAGVEEDEARPLLPDLTAGGGELGSRHAHATGSGNSSLNAAWSVGYTCTN